MTDESSGNELSIIFDSTFSYVCVCSKNDSDNAIPCLYDFPFLFLIGSNYVLNKRNPNSQNPTTKFAILLIFKVHFIILIIYCYFFSEYISY